MHTLLQRQIEMRGDHEKYHNEYCEPACKLNQVARFLTRSHFGLSAQNGFVH